MLKPLPIQPKCMAILTRGKLAGKVVYVDQKKPDEDLWMVWYHKLAMACPSSHLLLVNGYVAPQGIEEFLANEVTIKKYAGKWK